MGDRLDCSLRPITQETLPYYHGIEGACVLFVSNGRGLKGVCCGGRRAQTLLRSGGMSGVTPMRTNSIHIRPCIWATVTHRHLTSALCMEVDARHCVLTIWCGCRPMTVACHGRLVSARREEPAATLLPSSDLLGDRG